MNEKPTDYPREEILKRAQEALRAVGNGRLAKVYFKFTCSRCGERVTFSDPNVLYERWTCCSCGLDQPVEKAGFMMELEWSSNRSEGEK